MNEQEQKEYDKKKDFHLRCCEKSGIVDNISYRSDDYPPKFYLVLEKLDLIMRLYVNDEMGTSGFDELIGLCGLIGLNGHLSYYMPKTARAFFLVLINPKQAYKIFEKSGIVYGNMNRAYADLRQYLIDNKETVAQCYCEYYALRDKISHYGDYDKDKT